MAIPLFLVLVGYAAGLLLPLCFPARTRVQNLIAHGLAAVAALGGIYLGMVVLPVPDPWEISVPSTLPRLTFAVLLDALSSFFLLMISLVGLAASIYA